MEPGEREGIVIRTDLPDVAVTLTKKGACKADPALGNNQYPHDVDVNAVYPVIAPESFISILEAASPLTKAIANHQALAPECIWTLRGLDDGTGDGVDGDGVTGALVAGDGVVGGGVTTGAGVEGALVAGDGVAGVGVDGVDEPPPKPTPVLMGLKLLQLEMTLERTTVFPVEEVTRNDTGVCTAAAAFITQYPQEVLVKEPQIL